MSTIARRRFVVAVAGAAVVSGCGSSAAAPTPTRPPTEPAQATTTGAESTPADAGEAVPAAVAALAPGEGAIVTIDGQPVAAYKADDGSVVLLSPQCPHAGCEVAWNATEKTWDCPCHDSRCNADGSRISGPAAAGLEAIS